ncbi:hypothetical protein PTSG_05118 [Salpingoeca rosetta]|uniref:F-BAR domain-containing protein n=1 Tax=Salpingoeca rosetta (strain ATCC 50818 / BSB-021) TaxID=946362 RepID=F2UAK3_SALR5|nr:uncharacterized protein PTSG_05118 [Salpingoeca rosetta]EGD73419.1 hypothetical protein PTSG_05118 [Salpingoeca rosetta]|eukprot:XP_004993701.1 hypothetical protein PTSG_05118 [Salpingoeca rosetta]
MPWGEDLWDQFQAVEKHAAQGNEATENIRNFIAKVAEVEREYATKLAAVCKSFGAVAERDTNTTFGHAWGTLVDSVNNIATHHGNLSTSLAAEVCQPLKQLVKEKTHEKDEHAKHYHKNEASLQKEFQAFEKSKKVYDKIDKEAESAKASFEKLERSESANRKKVDLSRREYASKAKAREEGQRTLADALDKLNRARTAHYYTEQRDVINAVQAMDEARNEAAVGNMLLMTDLYFALHKEEHTALTRAADACKQFNKDSDSQDLQRALATGKPLPGTVA